jgi:hypothetical protein
MSVEGRGWVTRVGIDLVNWQQEEPAGFDRRRQLSAGGTSRMSREAQVRICERVCQEDVKTSCCTKDEGGPFGAVLRGKVSNCRKLLRAKAAVVNVPVKRRGILITSCGDQKDERKRTCG